VELDFLDNFTRHFSQRTGLQDFSFLAGRFFAWKSVRNGATFAFSSEKVSTPCLVRGASRRGVGGRASAGAWPPKRGRVTVQGRSHGHRSAAVKSVPCCAENKANRAKTVSLCEDGKADAT